MSTTSEVAVPEPKGRRRPLSPAERSALAKQVITLFRYWKLDSATQSAMLGLSEKAYSTLKGYAEGAPLADSRDLLDRVGHLLGIHKSLRVLFPHNRKLAYQWPTAPNRQLGGLRPIDIVRDQGLSGLVALREFVGQLCDEELTKSE